MSIWLILPFVLLFSFLLAAGVAVTVGQSAADQEPLAGTQPERMNPSDRKYIRQLWAVCAVAWAAGLILWFLPIPVMWNALAGYLIGVGHAMTFVIPGLNRRLLERG